MAVFNKNSIAQVSGYDNPCITGELVYQQKTFWNLALTSEDGVTPVNLTGATIDAQIIRRTLTNVQDTRYGLTFDIGDYTPTPTPVSLTISNRVDLAGTFTLVIDDTSWIAVARALAMKPALILADEPTGNLDTKSADGVFELLQSVCKEQGTTVLFVTHNPLLSARCEKTIEVVDGQIR